MSTVWWVLIIGSLVGVWLYITTLLWLIGSMGDDE
jgi:hypothetical protein